MEDLKTMSKITERDEERERIVLYRLIRECKSNIESYVDS